MGGCLWELTEEEWCPGDPSGSSCPLVRVLSTMRLTGDMDISLGQESLDDSYNDFALCRALFTGDGVSFLYPDLNTGLQGRFVAATMLAAGVICDYSPEFMRLDCIL